MRRHVLGGIAIVFLGAGLALWFFTDADYAWVALRIGMVLGAIWLALPQVVQSFSTIPKWTIYAAAAAVAVAAFPKSILIVLPIVGGFAVLQFVRWLFKPPAGRRRSGEKGRVKESLPSTTVLTPGDRANRRD